MATDLTDNLVSFLEDKLVEFNPSISVGEGTAIRDLFIKPFSVIFQPVVDEILRIRANLSLEDADTLEDTDLDRLAANFFITRKSGGRATGTVRVFFSEPVEEFFPQGTVFLAANGVRFVSTSNTTITSAGLRLNTFGDLFFFDISVEAEEPGVSGNIPANFISDILTGSENLTDVDNPAAFSGGVDTETNEELIARLSIAITFRNLINKPGAKLILLENFERLLDVLVVGFGDTFDVEDEEIGTGDGVTVLYQLSETEDVISNSLAVTVQVQDETVSGPVPNPFTLKFFPVDTDTLELHVGTITGTLLAEGTANDYTIDASTGTVTLTAAGVIAVGASDVHAKYNAVDIDASLVSTDFNGVVTFTATPSVGDILLATFTYYLMRRDRMSGDNLVLGDDSFGTQTNVHIGGKVDYYLKFQGLDEKEVRINSLKDENFLFDQAASDPAPTATQQYVTGVTLPLISVKNAEEVDTATNLPSGTFLTPGLNIKDELVGLGDGATTSFQLDFFPVNSGSLELRESTITGTLLVDPVDYTVNLTTGAITLTPAGLVVLGSNQLHAKYTTGDFSIDILDNKLNLNMSTKQKVQITVHNAAFLGSDIFLRYFTDDDFQDVQGFIDDDANRIVTADLLARAPLPVFVDVNVEYARVNGTPTGTTIVTNLTNFINGLNIGECLSVFDIANHLSDSGVNFVKLPMTIDAEKINLDFTPVTLSSQDRITIPPNAQIVARDITATEVTLKSCSSI